MLQVSFCAGEGEGRGDLREAEFETIEEIIEWADKISASKGFSSVFKSKFQVHSDTQDQWGTGYYWLSVTKV